MEFQSIDAHYTLKLVQLVLDFVAATAVRERVRTSGRLAIAHRFMGGITSESTFRIRETDAKVCRPLKRAHVSNINR